MGDSAIRYFGSLLLGFGLDDGTAASITIDSASVFYTSGDCFALKFISPVTQSSANLDLYLYCTGVTGSPTLKAALRGGPTGTEDDDRPSQGGSELATTASDVSPTANTWDLYRITSASLTEGNTYFILVYNTHATPASNYASIQYAPATDTPNNGIQSSQISFFKGGYSNDSFATDGTFAQSGSAVLKFSDGTIIGCPYVADGSAHASNTNYRGMQLTFSSTVEFCGISVSNGAGTITNVGIWNSTGTQLVLSSAFDRNQNINGASTFFARTTLTHGTYNFLLKAGSASTLGTLYTMGEVEANLPADVLACRSFTGAYVDGAATGSLTVDATQIFAMSIWISDLPAVASGGGNSVIGSGIIRALEL